MQRKRRQFYINQWRGTLDQWQQNGEANFNAQEDAEQMLALPKIVTHDSILSDHSDRLEEGHDSLRRINALAVYAAESGVDTEANGQAGSSSPAWPLHFTQLPGHP